MRPFEEQLPHRLRVSRMVMARGVTRMRSAQMKTRGGSAHLAWVMRGWVTRLISPVQTRRGALHARFFGRGRAGAEGRKGSSPGQSTIWRSNGPA